MGQETVILWQPTATEEKSVLCDWLASGSWRLLAIARVKSVTKYTVLH